MRKTYNRIEGDQRKVGDIIARSGPPAPHSNYPKVEEFLECNRPASCVPRGESVNMRPDRDFGAMGIDKFEYGYVHQVEPIDPVEVRYIEWIGALQARYPKSGVGLPESTLASPMPNLRNAIGAEKSRRNPGRSMRPGRPRCCRSRAS